MKDDLVLEIVSGTMAGQGLKVDPSRVVRFGRADSCDFVFVNDPQISGSHFEVEFIDSRWRLRDLGSTNGTFVNGTRVRDSVLVDGDEIGAGSSKFIARFREADRTGQSRDAAAMPDLRPVTAPSFQDSAAAVEHEEAAAEDDREVLLLTNDSPFAVGTLLGEATPGRAYLTVVIKATFAFDQEGRVDWATKQLPLFDADVLEDPDNPASPVRFESDLVPFKPRADVVLVGRACAPGRAPVPELDVRLRVGALDKTIRVFGDRRWSFPTRLAIGPRMSAPEPFREMELTYARAFGGIDEAAALYCAQNLAGVGFIGDCTPASIHGRRLPNLEDPENLITTWDSRPTPVGFGFYGRGWAPRLQLAGTFDENYRARRHPLPPEDFDSAYYNGAHPDMQVAGYLHSGVAVDLFNVHPDGPLHFLLPRLRPRVIVQRYRRAAAHAMTADDRPSPSSGADALISPEPPLAPAFDTLVLIPEHRMFYEVFRCTLPLPSLDAIDVHSIAVTLATAQE